MRERGIGARVTDAAIAAVFRSRAITGNDDGKRALHLDIDRRPLVAL